MKHSKTLFAALALAALPLTASAQGEADATVEADASATVSTDGTGDVDANANADANVTVAATATGAYPQQQILRPLTLNASKLRVQADLPIVRTSFDDGLGNSTSDTSVLLFLGASYGVSDQLEVGGSYALALSEFDAEGGLSAYARYAVINSAKMQLALSGALAFGIAESDFEISLGANFRYRLTDKLAIYTGATQGNNYGAAGSLAGGLLSLPGNQLSFGFDPTRIVLDLPVGVEIQATPNVYLTASTQIANLNIEPSEGSGFIFADYIPLSVSGWFTQDKLDAGLTLSFPDLENAGDLFAIMLSGRYHL